MSITALQVHPPTIHEPQSIVSTPSTDERPSLPSIGYDISRPPSTSSQASSYHLQRRPSPVPGLQLPGLSQLTALASAATSRRGSPDNIGPQNDNHIVFRQTLTPPSMSATTPLGPGGQPPVCLNCGTYTTPMWRRDEQGSVLCNACGLFFKLHGKPRPISLKTDVIKSRNRVRAANGITARKKSTHDGTPVKHADSADPASAAAEALRRVTAAHQANGQDLARSRSPISRTGTPNGSHPSNIAPQALFDSVSMEHQAPFFVSSLQDPTFRVASPLRPESSMTNDNQQPYAVLLQQATKLQMRVSELEVINSLFKGRVTELEASQEEQRSKDQAAREALQAKDVLLSQLQQRIQELEEELVDTSSERPTKRARLVETSDEQAADFIDSSLMEPL